MKYMIVAENKYMKTRLYLSVSPIHEDKKDRVGVQCGWAIDPMDGLKFSNPIQKIISLWKDKLKRVSLPMLRRDYYEFFILSSNGSIVKDLPV